MDAQELHLKIVKHLKDHKATTKWWNGNKESYTMDVPMMIVAAMIDFPYASEAPTQEEISKKGQELWEKDQKTNPNPVNPHAYFYGFKSCAKWLLSKVRDQEGWISVEDRKPEPHKELDSQYHKVRAIFELNGTIMNEDVVWNYYGDFIFMGINITDLVTHWQSLPKPPVKE